jgi:transcriptional regulator with XRE-family HTH domain
LVDGFSDTSQDSERRFGQRLRELRRLRRWSQEEVAAQMRALGYGWLQTTVTKTEAADRPIRLNEAVSLAALLELGVDDVLMSVQEGDPDRLRQIEREKQNLHVKTVLLLHAEETLQDEAADARRRAKAIEQELIAARSKIRKLEAERRVVIRRGER